VRGGRQRVCHFPTPPKHHNTEPMPRDDAPKGDTLFAHTLSDEDERARKVRGVPEPTLWHRLHFFWAIFWISLTTIPFSLALMTAYHFRPTARTFKRWSSRWARVILGGIGVSLDVEDRSELTPEAPCIFVANHQNLLDIFTTAAAIPYPFGYLAKKELTRVPFLSLALRHSPSLFIDRSSRRASMRSLAGAVQSIREGQSVLFFAEGSRAYAPVMHPFKKGAFYVAAKAGVPLVPVTIRDSYRVMDERHYASRPGTIRLTIGVPIALEDFDSDDTPAVMNAVRERMEAELAGERRRAEGEEAAADPSAGGTAQNGEP
jgi:1-acyl-sn-glycerol-3-phosphate acyltransferase